MSVKKPITTKEIDTWKACVMHGGKYEFSQIYQVIQDRGLGYAGWGRGVVLQNSMTGKNDIVHFYL